MALCVRDIFLICKNIKENDKMDGIKIKFFGDSIKK